MELKQQVTVSPEEIRKLILEHLVRKGIRIDHRSAEFKRDNSFFALTMSEDEIYIADTKAILSKPLEQFELKNKKLKNKLLERLPPRSTIGALLKKEPNSAVAESSRADFVKDNTIKPNLLENQSLKKNKVTPVEEKELIEVFGLLGVKLEKVFIYKGGLH